MDRCVVTRAARIRARSCGAALTLAGCRDRAAERARSGAAHVAFSGPLPEAPGHNLVVVELNFPPNAAAPSTPERHPPGHRHPGSVYVYVTQGAVRLGIEGQPVQVVRAGEIFFEPIGAHHIVARTRARRNRHGQSPS